MAEQRESLSGLTESEAELLWAGAPALPSEQWRQFYAATGGLPEPIRRTVAAYRHNGELARPTDWRAQVADWAQETIWDRLAPDAQRLLAAAHALESASWGEQAAQVCQRLGINTITLNDLRRRELLPYLDLAYQGYGDGIARLGTKMIETFLAGRDIFGANRFAKFDFTHTFGGGRIGVMNAGQPCACQPLGNRRSKIG